MITLLNLLLTSTHRHMITSSPRTAPSGEDLITISCENTKFSLPAPGAPWQLRRHCRCPRPRLAASPAAPATAERPLPQILLEPRLGAAASPLQRCRGVTGSAFCIRHALSIAFMLPHSHGALSQLVSCYAGWELRESEQLIRSLLGGKTRVTGAVQTPVSLVLQLSFLLEMK